jgi:mannose-6-phosphate isomerase-like protein (cupin superfamily)
MAFDRAVVSSPDQGLAFDKWGRRNVMHATALQTGGAIGIWEAWPAAGTGVPMHVHSREDEVFRVLEGNFRFWCGGEEYQAGPGFTIVLPRHVPHGFLNVGETAGRLLTMVMPGGFEGIFLEIEKLGDDPDPAALAALDEKYGVRDV